MQFDHRPGEVKKGNISNMKSMYSVEALQAEMDKCDLVCANCHALRTEQRRLDNIGQVETIQGHHMSAHSGLTQCEHISLF